MRGSQSEVGVRGVGNIGKQAIVIQCGTVPPLRGGVRW